MEMCEESPTTALVSSLKRPAGQSTEVKSGGLAELRGSGVREKRQLVFAGQLCVGRGPAEIGLRRSSEHPN